MKEKAEAETAALKAADVAASDKVRREGEEKEDGMCPVCGAVWCCLGGKVRREGEKWTPCVWCCVWCCKVGREGGGKTPCV